MLPSWPELVGFVILMLAAVASIALMRMPHARPARADGERALVWDPILTDALRPLFAVALLAIPYCPWLPDWLPVLRLLGGPLRWLLWSVVLGQVALIAVLRFAPWGRAWLEGDRRAAIAIVFVVSLATYEIASAQLVETDFFPARLLLWLVGAATTVWLCRRSPMTPPGSAALHVTLYTAVAFTIIVSIAALLPGARQQLRFDPEARGRLPMLDTFDATARPVAVVYDPFSVVPPSAVPPLFSLTAVPGQRRAPQPTRVLLNARFGLPAGEYDVELRRSPASRTVAQGAVGLQIGREGGPVETWPVVMSSGDEWRQRFRLPLDAEFVAFRADPELERSTTLLRLRPVQVVDAGRRLRTDAIVAAASFGSTLVFFHDAVSYIEPGGFWARGRSKMRVTLAKPEAPDSFALNLHCGARANQVTVLTPHGSWRLELAPNVARTLVLPANHQALMPLDIATASGFVPAEIEPGNPDRRVLGCWITFAS